MRRLGIGPKLMDFTRDVFGAVDAWFDSVTERFNLQTSSSDQTTSTVPKSQWGLFKNSSSGDVRLIVNDDDTLKYIGLNSGGTAPPSAHASSHAVSGSDPVYIASGTAVTASGTSVDFTSLPPGLKRITVLYNGVSFNAADAVLTQLGDSGGPENTGYASLAVNINTGATPVIMASVTNGFGFTAVGAANALTGALVIQNVNDNNWVATGWARISASAANYFTCTGSKTLSGTLDRIRITGSAGGSFDAGTINILYE